MESEEQCFDHILQTLLKNDDILSCFVEWKETPEYLELLAPLGISMLHFTELLDTLQKKEYIVYRTVEQLYPNSPPDFYKQHAFHPCIIRLTIQGKFFIKNGGYGNKNIPKKLLDIWDGTKGQYQKAINDLIIVNPSIGEPFVIEKDGSLKWTYFNSSKGNGWLKYLQAFAYLCLEKKLIKEDYRNLSAPKWREILRNTFGLHAFDTKPFQSLRSQEPLPKYKKAFSFLYNL